jgi:hypothetical protein
MLSYAWRGKWPQLRAPRILSVALNGAPATSSVTIAPGKEGLLEVVFDGDSVQPVEAVWYILHESTDKRIGGDAEEKPDQVPVQFLSTTSASARFVTPDRAGHYRIFGYFYSANRATVATANFPFRVEESD